MSGKSMTLKTRKGMIMNERVVLGLDISTSTIGMCGISLEKELKFLSYVTLKKQKGLYSKADAFKEELLKYKDIVTDVAIEEPLVMYKDGFSRAQILSMLSQFNGMCGMLSYFIYNTEPVMYNVNTARKLAVPEMKFPKGSNRKFIVQENMESKYPEIDWPLKRTGTLKDECYDMADAMIIALAHVQTLLKGE
jgi:hypothetical protein